MGNLYEDAKRAIMEMFNDKSYTPQECKDNLRGLKDELDILIDAISFDISSEQL